MIREKPKKSPFLTPGRISTLQWILLGIIFLFTFGIRFYKITDVPAGFYCDEASIGYNAFTLGGWGIDDTGAKFPLYIKSFGVQKNPVFVYSAIIPVKLFGLSERSVRLTSVMFGSFTVLGIFWLMYEIWGAIAGLAAAAFLSVTPWNFHFSRIAFELISMPCVFVFGLAALVRSLRKGRWYWVWAGILLGISIHTYIMITVFLPLFLLLFTILYVPDLWFHRKFVSLGLLCFLLFAAPAIYYHFTTKDTLHFHASSWLNSSEGRNLSEKARLFWDHYKQYYSYGFLFEHGDVNARHSVKGHGEIYRSFIPMAGLGILLMLIPLRRINLLLLWWLAIFPVGAAFTNDTYATRSIMGSPLPSIFSAAAFIHVWALFRWIKWRWLRWPLHSILIGAAFIPVGQDAWVYFQKYFMEYNKMSASGIYGFQFGYREAIAFMEERADQYPQRLFSATNVNNPDIFANFYKKIDPHEWLATFNNGYKFLRPFDYPMYSLDVPTLFALPENELYYFDDYDILHRVIDANNLPEFTIAHIKKRKTPLLQWSLMGLFDNQEAETHGLPYPHPYRSINEERDGLSGKVHWRPYEGRYVLLEFQEFFKGMDPRYSPGNPEDVYAEGVTYLSFPKETTCTLEYWGTNDHLALWLNGQNILSSTLIGDYMNKLRLTFREGWNEIFFRSCEQAGDWYVIFVLMDESGRSYDNLIQQPFPPEGFDLNQTE